MSLKHYPIIKLTVLEDKKYCCCDYETALKVNTEGPSASQHLPMEHTPCIRLCSLKAALLKEQKHKNTMQALSYDRTHPHLLCFPCSCESVKDQFGRSPMFYFYPLQPCQRCKNTTNDPNNSSNQLLSQ